MTAASKVALRIRAPLGGACLDVGDFGLAVAAASGLPVELQPASYANRSEEDLRPTRGFRTARRLRVSHTGGCVTHLDEGSHLDCRNHRNDRTRP